VTATDELRRLLDERGVEWMPSVWSAKDETFYKVGDVGYLATELSSGKMKVCIEGYPTPEQTIAATLGTGTCHADETDTVECVCDGIGHYGESLSVHVMECSACGGTYEYVNGSYEYCPRCGAKVVVE
jgi:hypothetical protein